MAITKQSGRQELIVASVDFTFADVPTTATIYDALDLPSNAVVVGGDFVVTTAWNTATSAAANIGDATLATRYGSAIDLKTAARTALTAAALGFVHTNTEKVLRVAPTYVGAAATAGAARLSVQYYVKGRSTFAQGLGH